MNLDVDLEAVWADWLAALDSKPGKGEWDLTALIQAACHVPTLVAEIERRRQPALTRQCYCPNCDSYHDTEA